jgi:carbon-monoxide dehydrogenase medium subunit
MFIQQHCCRIIYHPLPSYKEAEDSMAQLAYTAPTSLAEATQALSGTEGARLFAGGTDLLVQMKLGQRSPQLVIDLKRIPELMEISLDTGGLRLGASVPGAVVTAHPRISQLFPGFAEALGVIGSSQIQGRASAGGNLCNASPAADSVPSMIANRARCIVAGSGGTRSVAAEDFNTGPRSNCLASDELLVAIEFPIPRPRSSDAYLRFIPRTEMDIAVAGAAVALSLDVDGVCSDARVAIGAVAPTALLVPAAAEALVGTSLDEDSLLRAGQAATEAANPVTDKRGTMEFKTSVVGVLVRRAAVIARERALAMEI